MLTPAYGHERKGVFEYKLHKGKVEFLKTLSIVSKAVEFVQMNVIRSVLVWY